MLLAFVVVASVQGVTGGGSVLGADREVLIVFDAALVVVLGLLLYTLSSRGTRPRVPGGSTPSSW